MTQKDAKDWDARWWKVIDNDTGKEINHAIWADDETGEYRIALPVSYELCPPPIQIETRHGNISLVNTLQDETLAISATGDPDGPFGVYTVDEHGSEMELVAGWSTWEGANQFVDEVRRS